MTDFVKRNPAAPQGFFGVEAAGLRWLAVDGGVRCARVVAQDAGSLTLERLESVPPTPTAAREFGARLAITHDAGAAAFGAAPDGWTGPGYFGPLSQPLPMSFQEHTTWGEFYAQERLHPMADLASGRLSRRTADMVQAVTDRCLRGEFDDDDVPARLHGDLWSGNVMWTSDGATLIDPAAHGGHRETDLAMLELFGCPYLDRVIEGYQTVHRLRDGWQSRTGLHQLYPLLAHVALFGAGYEGQTAAAATSVLA